MKVDRTIIESFKNTGLMEKAQKKIEKSTGYVVFDSDLIYALEDGLIFHTTNDYNEDRFFLYGIKQDRAKLLIEDEVEDIVSNRKNIKDFFQKKKK